MDAITLLKNDHQDVEKLFKRFEQAGDEAYVEKRDIVDRIIEALSKHASIEEQLFYPVTRATVPETEDIALESMEEHHIVKWLLSELDGMDPKHERFDAKTTVLIENVRHHVEEEEDEYFPKVRDELGRNALNELGDAMQDARKLAPTHPHPRSPDTPPGNLIAGAGAGVVDRVTDTVSGVAQGGVAALQDVIARVTGSKQRVSSPTGTPTAKRAADRTRGGASDATDRAVSAVQQARDTGEEAVDDARRAAANRIRPPANTTSRKRSAAGKKAATTRKRAATKRSAAAKKAASTRKRNAAKSSATRRTSSTAKKATGTAKRTTRKATGTTKRTTRKATGTAKKTTRKATGAAKRTARKSTGTAKRTARKSTGTAKRAATRTRTTAKKAGRTTKATAKRAARRTPASSSR
jgi:hemerythrin superfamily protein